MRVCVSKAEAVVPFLFLHPIPLEANFAAQSRFALINFEDLSTIVVVIIIAIVDVIMRSMN